MEAGAAGGAGGVGGDDRGVRMGEERGDGGVEAGNTCAWGE